MKHLPAWLAPPPVYAPTESDHMKNAATAELARSSREATGLLVQEFADLINCSKRTVYAWEAGEKAVSPLAQMVLAEVRDGWRPVMRRRIAK